MKKNVPFWVLMLVASTVLFPRVAFAQGAGQADLLERAYSTDSYELLSRFFDNWHKDVTSNEAEASDPWLKEAYKVYSAVCQPEMLKRWHVSMSEKPFLIVQGDIWKIGFVQQNNRFFRKGEIPYNLNFTLVDSDVTFRPKLQADSVVTVYLTDGYNKLVKDFTETYYLPPLRFELSDIIDTDGNVVDKTDGDVVDYTEPIGLAVEENELLNRGHYLEKYVNNISFWMFGNWQLEPFFSIIKIVFSPSRKFAIVTYRMSRSGGTIVLEKKHGKWTFLRQTERSFFD